MGCAPCWLWTPLTDIPNVSSASGGILYVGARAWLPHTFPCGSEVAPHLLLSFSGEENLSQSARL
jgi:hypothetical protein